MNSRDIHYVGVNDHILDFFEGQYSIPNGMAYNSYAILDEKTAVMDSVDARFTDVWLENIRSVCGSRQPDYLIVQHMEPDHSGSILHFMEAFPNATLVASARAFVMIKNFFGAEFPQRQITVGDGDTLSLGSHQLQFFTAAMIHWPEVIMTYDSMEKTLFSADAFGKFGALDAPADDWISEARRYYFGIVGKYGGPVQTLLKKIAGLDIRRICPLHGPTLNENIQHYIDLYNTWSSYTPEEDGIVIAYTSVYGNTKKAVMLLAEELQKTQKVVVYDLARCDQSDALADAFRYSKLVLATTTYNGSIFPFMYQFIHHLVEHGFSNRMVALIENGSWAPAASRGMHALLEGCKGLTFARNEVKILSALTEDGIAALHALAEELSLPPVQAQEEPAAPAAAKKFVCKICGYVHEADELPADFHCPLCKTGAENFEEVR